jgi:hypothetical protein
MLKKKVSFFPPHLVYIYAIYALYKIDVRNQMKSGGYTYHRLQMMDNSNRSFIRKDDTRRIFLKAILDKVCKVYFSCCN